MANVNSLTSNSYSSSTSLYGNRNVLTGLASGMDTEAMIQNSVTGYQTKIQELQQSQEKLEWKQDAYRELIDQMYSITNKYTSYTSTTNLSSNTFFTSSVTTTANGSNASAITATGKATSDIQINAVTQLATAARYAVDAGALNLSASQKAVGGAINWDNNTTKGTLSGTMTLKLGNNSIDIKFTDDDKYANTSELLSGINKKLQDQNADVAAVMSGSDIKFVVTGDAAKKGDSVYISGASGNLKEKLNVATASSTADEKRFEYTSFSLNVEESELTETMTMAQHLSGKTIDVTLDGVTKSIKIGDLSGIEKPDLSTYDQEIESINAKFDQVKNTEMTDDERAQKNAELREELRIAQVNRSSALNTAMTASLKDDLQASINKEFGTNRITVGVTDVGGLKFDVAEGSGSTVKVTSSIGDELGIGEAGVSNYFNTSQKLGDLLGTEWLDKNARIEGTLDNNAAERYFDKEGNELKLSDGVYYRTNSDGSIMTKDGEKVAGTRANTLYTDTDGNLIKKYANENTYYRVNEKGEWLYGMEINGATINGITKDTALESLINKISSNTAAGVKVSYSNLTSQFVFTANETGEGGKISFDSKLAQRLFGISGDSDAQTLGTVFTGANWASDAVKIGGVSVAGTSGFTSDSKLEDLRALINNAGFSFRIDYDERTNAYSFVSASTGAALENFDRSLVIGGDTYKLTDIFKTDTGATFTKGADAIVKATVNGKELTLKRSSNVVNMDGLSVTLKSTFDSNAVDGGDAVTFKTSSDSDKIVDAIKSFVEEVNKLMTSVHDAVTTQPLTRSTSSGKGSTYSHKSGYEPLTEDDKNSMSEDAIKKYEEKAKTGLLFGDSDLRTLYDKLLTGIQSYGADRIDMEAIGLTTTYSNGATTLSLNETKLRAALDSDPDKVRNVFTKTKEGGSATEGLMSTLKSTLNAYGSTSLASPGILVRKAGTKLSAVSLLNNNIQSQISNLDSQIESWQTKLSNRIDYYTKQFTQLEQLMSTMNNQSSMLADLMGY